MQLCPLEILGFSIKRLQYRNQRAADAQLASLGISLVQWNALREIERNPGLSMHRLAELTFNSDQAFGTLMARLLRQKLIERQPGTGRANVHRLTPHGRTLVAGGHKCLRQVLARTFAPLSAEERTRLQSLLTKVLGDDCPYAPAAARSPVTRFAKTLVGFVPEPGRPIVPTGRLPKRGSRPTPPAA